MKLPIEPGEKYALIALDAAADFSDMIEMGTGTYALPHAAFDLPEHWRQWLGSIRTDALQRAGLVLLTKLRSDAPAVLDGDNAALVRRIGFLY